jgi:hypothetical protein
MRKITWISSTALQIQNGNESNQRLVTMTISLKKIDTSYWKTDDPEWIAKREAYWPTIERMLKRYKSQKKKALNPIRDYYLRGKMPNWKALKDWEDSFRHLDIFLFLWLHPSWDEQVLTELRNAYISSDLVIYEDVFKGFAVFLDSQKTGPTIHFWTMEKLTYPYLDGHGELLFRVLMGDRTVTEYEIQGHPTYDEKKIFKIPCDDLTAIGAMGAWLCLKRLLPINEEFLLQYDEPLEWWYESVKDVDYFNLCEFNKKLKPSAYKYLYRICHFDTEKEGDTCRTRFVFKIRKILDEREFVPEIKQMWLDVKAGEVEVKDPWE